MLNAERDGSLDMFSKNCNPYSTLCSRARRFAPQYCREVETPRYDVTRHDVT